MKVSVVIPVKDRHDLAKQAVASVLNQGVEVEILVADDSQQAFSHEDSRVKVLREEGPEIKEKINFIARARNRGLAKASGEYIAFLDSDDVFFPGLLEQALNKIPSEAKEVGVCALSQKIFDGPYPLIQKLKLLILNWAKDFFLMMSFLFHKGLLRKDLVYLCQISHMVFKRSAFQGLQFDIHQRYCEDWKLFLNIQGPIAILPKKLVGFRYSQNSNTPSQNRQNSGEKEAVYAKFIEFFEQTVGESVFTLMFRVYTHFLLIK